MNGDFEQIIWPEHPPLLTRPDAWERNKEVIRMLCKLGEVIEWENDVPRGGIFEHMPHRYRINGVLVEFLPDWTYYLVAGEAFDLPEQERDITDAIGVVTGLHKLQRILGIIN